MAVPERPSQPAQNQRILIIDDHDVIRRTLRQFIEARGDMIVCGECATSEAALETLQGSAPDLVLLDLSLRNETGFDLLQQIGAMRPDLPVLIVSMHSDTLFAQPALERGARGYLMKSDITEQLYEAMECLLGGGLYFNDDVLRQQGNRSAG